MGHFIDLTGKAVGSWTVLERAGNDKYGKMMWLCKCGCGKVKRVAGYSMRRGESSSCKSCSNKENKFGITHGGCKTKLYAVWHSMRQRCKNINDQAWKHYGGRGIKVYREWHKFEIFRNWALTNGYKEGLEIDRIDNNKGYYPENCRWITRKEQCRNTRRNRYITINNRTKTVIEWAEEYGINVNVLRSRIRLGWIGVKLLQATKHRERIKK